MVTKENLDLNRAKLCWVTSTQSIDSDYTDMVPSLDLQLWLSTVLLTLLQIWHGVHVVSSSKQRRILSQKRTFHNSLFRGEYPIRVRFKESSQSSANLCVQIKILKSGITILPDMRFQVPIICYRFKNVLCRVSIYSLELKSIQLLKGNPCVE